MFKIRVKRGFNKKSGEVYSKVTIIEADKGLGRKIIPYLNMANILKCIKSYTLTADTPEELYHEEAVLLRQIRCRISIIRENMKVKSSIRIIGY